MIKYVGLVIVCIGLFSTYRLLNKDPELKIFPGSCEDNCPDIDYGMKCSVHSKTEETGLDFKHLGFCGDIPGRFLKVDKFGVHDKALKGHWSGNLIKDNQPACHNFCSKMRGPEGLLCRVPGVGELASLITAEQNEYKLFMPDVFGASARGPYWTSTPLKSSNTAGFFVNTGYGILSFKAAKRELLCVCFCPEEEEPQLPPVEITEKKQSENENEGEQDQKNDENSEENDEEFEDEEEEESGSAEY